MIFLFPRWERLISCRVHTITIVKKLKSFNLLLPDLCSLKAVPIWWTQKISWIIFCSCMVDSNWRIIFNSNLTATHCFIVSWYWSLKPTEISEGSYPKMDVSMSSPLPWFRGGNTNLCPQHQGFSASGTPRSPLLPPDIKFGDIGSNYGWFSDSEW